MINDAHTPETCPVCEKPPGLCVCAAIAPLDNAVEVLILRHPQEQDKLLGTARIATLQLKNAQLRTGLSWPNLGKALGHPADPKQWGVLYLGSAKESAATLPDPLTIVSRKGTAVPDQKAVLAGLRGVIALDGNWQQVKALWWRNAWLLKCHRLILNPASPSLYGNLRREPRRESVSTIEAIAQTLAILGDDPKIESQVLAPFRVLLDRSRTPGKARPS